MSGKTVLQPGPDHPITVEPNSSRVVVSVGGKVVADTTHALQLHESTYPAVQYIPRADVDLTQLERTDHSTYCPYKGDASYYSLRAGDDLAENSVWTYEAPHDAVAAIKDHLAFYGNVADVAVSPA
ncbi:DUF427 domain-containing protein [uncultured Jatrophihabitans sp.]|uniref:DUF427 domain-containing protein n=1 Tax=uncultured Jatrophihabitans sp. TaxID=1610747 RepID=UPI0035CA6BC0